MEGRLMIVPTGIGPTYLDMLSDRMTNISMMERAAIKVATREGRDYRRCPKVLVLDGEFNRLSRLYDDIVYGPAQASYVVVHRG